MKINKPITFHIPALFVQELHKHLIANQPGFKYDLIYFYYVVHYIQEQQIKNKNRNENGSEYVPINFNYLKSITVCNIGDYVKILKNGDFILCDNHYIIGEKSKGYIINPVFLKGTEAVEVKSESKLFNKIINDQRRKKAHHNRLEPFLKSMNDAFMKMELDYPNAERWILSPPNEEKRNFYMTALSQLKDKRFRYFKRNKTNNRLDTNLTNLKSQLKQFIIGDYVSIDLKNSQPFFGGMLLNNIIKKDNINKDMKQEDNVQGTLCYYFLSSFLIETFGIKRLKAVSKIHQNKKKAFLVNLNLYTSSVIKGDLYDDFVKSYSNGITRSEAKQIMFKVLFSKNEIHDKYNKFIPYKKEKEVFASVYPFVYESFKMLKTKDNVLLPVFLQKLESYIFIDCIAKELVNAGIIPLTIHDSVIVKAEQQQIALEIINKVFLEKFGVIPAFDIKSLRKD